MDNTRKPITLAGHYLSMGKAMKALETLDGAASQLMEYPEFWQLRCLTLVQLERFDDAGETGRIGLARYPDDAEILHLLAHVELHRGDLAGAERLLLACLRRSPDSAGHLACYAELLLRGAKFDAAELVLRAAARLSPDHPKVREVQVTHATVRYGGKRAERAARRFVAYAPEVTRGYATLGDIAYRNCDLAEARTHFAHVAYLDPEHPTVQRCLNVTQLESRPMMRPVMLVRRLGLAQVLIVQIISILAPLWAGYDGIATLLALAWALFWAFCAGASMLTRQAMKGQAQ
jgi:tetratricopeptide (TPR) repeat protein